MCRSTSQTSSDRTLAPSSTVIPANGQISRFLDGAPFNGGSPILGTFTFVASAPVVPVAIRGYFTERSEFLMTTMSVIDLALPAATDTIVLPHFADGGGFTTQFVLVNPRDDTLSGTLQFYSTGSVAPTNAPGIPVAVQIDGQTATSFNFSIPPPSSRRLQTSGGGAAIQSGSVRFVPNPGSATPSVQGIFSYRQGGVMVSEAGIPAIPASTAFRVYVESAGALGVAGSIQSGLALANPSALPATVVLELTSLAGTPTGNVETLTVPANGQVAMFLGSIGSFASCARPLPGSASHFCRVSGNFRSRASGTIQRARRVSDDDDRSDHRRRSSAKRRFVLPSHCRRRGFYNPGHSFRWKCGPIVFRRVAVFNAVRTAARAEFPVAFRRVLRPPLTSGS